MESDAQGWDAIVAAWKPLYGDREPLHFGNVLPFGAGGKDPIHGMDLHFNSKPVPHWHLITYGFSELWGKESDDPEVSGYGFELTARVKIDVSHGEATRLAAGDYAICKTGSENSRGRVVPFWAMNCLQNLARYVFESGNAFDDGHHVDLLGPMRTDSNTLIRAAAFRLDPVLPPISTPNGSVNFLQLVGLTNDEYEATKDWNTLSVLNLMAEQDPLLVIDLERKSALENPRLRAAIAAGAAREGSSQAYTMTKGVKWRKAKHLKSEILILELPALVVPDVQKMLRARIPFGKPYAVLSGEVEIHFEPGGSIEWRDDEGALGIDVSGEWVEAFCNKVRPLRGRYRVWDSPPFDVIVNPSPIYDQDDKVIRVIG